MATGYVSSVLILVLFVGLAGLPWLFRQANLLRARSWPSVRGQVESAWVSQEQHGQARFFKGKLAYSYSVKGERYTGNMQLNFGGREDRANAWAARFPHGLPLEVRYSPANVSASVFDERDQHPMV